MHVRCRVNGSVMNACKVRIVNQINKHIDTSYDRVFEV